MDIYAKLPLDIKIMIDYHVRDVHFKSKILPIINHRRRMFIKSYLNCIYIDSLSTDLYFWFNIPEEQWGSYAPKDKYVKCDYGN